jgi:hypothetical protein
VAEVAVVHMVAEVVLVDTELPKKLCSARQHILLLSELEEHRELTMALVIQVVIHHLHLAA